MPLRVYVAACLPPGGGGGSLYSFINLSECPHSMGLVSVTVCLYMFVSPDIPCPGLPQTFFLHCLKGSSLGSRLWCLTVSLSLSHWYPGSGVVLDCIDS